MDFEVKIQFYTPDSIPSAVGWFVVEAESEGEAVKKKMEELYKSGYAINEISLVSVIPI